MPTVHLSPFPFILAISFPLFLSHPYAYVGPTIAQPTQSSTFPFSFSLFEIPCHFPFPPLELTQSYHFSFHLSFSSSI
ncbi:hypothetical protein RND81_09G079900 [Saponaria officinalis]|uniref:Secreted protein n=1 Tax=Saponaria officinalis TaxID=3572 RepID=A0AAW1IK84_SAPOF